MSFKVCKIVDVHMLIQARKELLSRKTITQRSESLQPQLLDQFFRFSNYFWSIEFAWLRATIMLFKVCKIVSVQKLIQARNDDDSETICHDVKSST